MLGKENVGKTHLFNLVQGTNYGKNESTNGVAVHSFRLKAKKSNLRLNWFDFGGQEVSALTSQFRFLKRIFY